MKNGIPCNETRFTNGKDRNRIVYQFVAFVAVNVDHHTNTTGIMFVV